MGGATEELRGPDAREGVAMSSLPEGEPFAAHADGENLSSRLPATDPGARAEFLRLATGAG